jgi:C1A family cysteine protease
MQRKWGWLPDLPDNRDRGFRRVTRRKIVEKVDLRPGCSPVEDQEDLGSCTANAGIGVYEYVERKEGMEQIDQSRLFLYFNTRLEEGTENFDSGAYIRDTIKALAKYGVCPESMWPYDVPKYTVKPPAKCYSVARKHVAIKYQRLETLEDMLACLADGFPFEFGFSVYESFESDAVANTGIVPMPKKSERLLGGHAVVAVGYDRSTERLTVRNSWGPIWGDKGYFYMPFDYVTDRNLSDDFWVVRLES